MGVSFKDGNGKVGKERWKGKKGERGEEGSRGEGKGGGGSLRPALSHLTIPLE